MDAQPHDYGAEQTARRARVLSDAGSESEVQFVRTCPQIKTAAFERTILSDKKLAALPRLLPQDASAVFKDRREPDNIGIAMPVGWDQFGAPATEQEPQVRAGRRASDAKMAEPEDWLRHLDWLDYADLGFFSVLAAGFGAAFLLSPPCPWRRFAIQHNDGDLHLVFAGVVPRKTHG